MASLEEIQGSIVALRCGEWYPFQQTRGVDVKLVATNDSLGTRAQK